MVVEVVGVGLGEDIGTVEGGTVIAIARAILTTDNRQSTTDKFKTSID